MQKMLEKITRLIKYCRHIHENLPDIPAPLLVATEDEGTLVLNAPNRAARQIVIALPQATLAGDCDHIRGPHTLILFVLEKRKEQTRTPEQTDKLYLETADTLNRLLTKFINDLSGASPDGQCPLLCGMEFVEAEIVPEAGRFGGWDGWSAALTLK